MANEDGVMERICIIEPQEILDVPVPRHELVPFHDRLPCKYFPFLPAIFLIVPVMINDRRSQSPKPGPRETLSNDGRNRSSKRPPHGVKAIL
jgi:hypothetical protein